MMIKTGNIYFKQINLQKVCFYHRVKQLGSTTCSLEVFTKLVNSAYLLHLTYNGIVVRKSKFRNNYVTPCDH